MANNTLPGDLAGLVYNMTKRLQGNSGTWILSGDEGYYLLTFTDSMGRICGTIKLDSKEEFEIDWPGSIKG